MSVLPVSVFAEMASGSAASGPPDSSTGSSSTVASSKAVSSRKRPRSHSSVVNDDQSRKLQEEDFTW